MVAFFSRNYLVLVLLVHVIVIDDLNFNLRLALGHFELHGRHLVFLLIMSWTVVRGRHDLNFDSLTIALRKMITTVSITTPTDLIIHVS